MACPRNLGQGSFAVIENGFVRKIARTIPYCCFTVSMALCCIVSQIKRGLAKFIHTAPAFDIPDLEIVFRIENQNGGATRRRKRFENTIRLLSSLVSMTDKWTDGRRDNDFIICPMLCFHWCATRRYFVLFLSACCSSSECSYTVPSLCALLLALFVLPSGEAVATCTFRQICQAVLLLLVSDWRDLNLC